MIFFFFFFFVSLCALERPSLCASDGYNIITCVRECSKDPVWVFRLVLKMSLAVMEGTFRYSD